MQGQAGARRGSSRYVPNSSGRITLTARKKDWLDDAEAFGGTVRGRKQAAPKQRERRRPNAKRTVGDILVQPGAGAEGQVFADADLERLRLRGHLDSLVGLVKGGKEATVYLVARGEERLAAKVYADLQSRSFRNDSAYWAGVYIGDKRVEKAMRQRSRAGQAAQQDIWVMREYANLWRLHEAGLPVPRPAVGPAVTDCIEAGGVVLMEFIGEGDTPAPRLSDVRLEPEEAASAYRQSVELLLAITRLGLVHGDFSTYNLLWHEGRVVLIDVPQMLEIEHAGREARELLRRDVTSLLTSFRRHRTPTDEDALMRAVGEALP